MTNPEEDAKFAFYAIGACNSSNYSAFVDLLTLAVHDTMVMSKLKDGDSLSSTMTAMAFCEALSRVLSCDIAAVADTLAHCPVVSARDKSRSLPLHLPQRIRLVSSRFAR